jgi:hypothetical protein
MQHEHLVLRQAFYRAWGLYHEASGVYWGDLTLANTEHRIAVRTTATALDTALTALLGYLNQLEPSARSEEERTHMARIHELLQHELALLPKTE